MLTDLTAAELPHYRSAQADPSDFDDFWRSTLANARSYDLGLVVKRVETALTTIDVYDVTFAGYGGDPIKAWLRVPAGSTGPLPTIVEYIGYGGGRGRAEERLLFSSSGFAHLVMDTRGQGSAWSVGETPDPHGSVSHSPGFLTMGIDSPENYYYRRVFTDAVRAVEAVRSLDLVDSSRVAVYGGSQGGGISLAATALLGDVAASIFLVPFLCDFPRVTLITDNDPYKEIGRYLNIHRDNTEAVHRTLAYFDGVNFAKRATTPALFTAALMDPICPPSSVYGAFNNYVGDKDITLWQYNGHEGGGTDDEIRAVHWFRDRFAEVETA
jgi:cephalosporin-C deacetylase